MFGPKIKVSKLLLEKLKLAVEVTGATSLEEYVERILETDVDRVLSKAGRTELSESEVDDIANKLKGLGYLE